MGVMLGGKNARKISTFRDIVVAQQYVNGEPALVLFPKIKKMNTTAYVVCLSAAFKYDDEKYLVQQSRLAANMMGLGDTMHAAMNVAEAIHLGIPDLVMMQPEPESIKRSVGEGKIMSSDGKEYEFEMTEDAETVH